MADPLSAVSAVASLADIVLRTSTKLYEFFSQLQNVPADVNGLSNSLLTWKAVSQAVKDLIARHSQSLLATEDAIALGGVYEALKSCEIGFASINVLVQEHRSGEPFKPARLLKDVRWIFDAKKIQSAQRSLESSKLALTTALSALSGFVAGFGRCIEFKLIRVQSE